MACTQKSLIPESFRPSRGMFWVNAPSQHPSDTQKTPIKHRFLCISYRSHTNLSYEPETFATTPFSVGGMIPFETSFNFIVSEITNA